MFPYSFSIVGNYVFVLFSFHFFPSQYLKGFITKEPMCHFHCLQFNVKLPCYGRLLTYLSFIFFSSNRWPFRALDDEAIKKGPYNTAKSVRPFARVEKSNLWDHMCYWGVVWKVLTRKPQSCQNRLYWYSVSVFPTHYKK